MQAPVVALQKIRKCYGTFEVLAIEQLELEGGIYWLQGQNGAGKTTCMKILAGLIPFEGEIILQGNVNSKQQPVRYRQLVNYAEAEPIYPGFLTGNDLIRLYNTTKGGDPATTERIAILLGISSFAANPVSTYSSGMLKKLSLLLGFIGTPAVILLDEPLITIDTATLPLLYQLIQEFHAKGVTFCITSHQPIPAGVLPVTATLAVENKNIVYK
jgi:ABC-2 type transport system ATP-binding protein